MSNYFLKGPVPTSNNNFISLAVVSVTVGAVGGTPAAVRQQDVGVTGASH